MWQPNRDQKVPGSDVVEKYTQHANTPDVRPDDGSSQKQLKVELLKYLTSRSRAKKTNLASPNTKIPDVNLISCNPKSSIGYHATAKASSRPKASLISNVVLDNATEESKSVKNETKNKRVSESNNGPEIQEEVNKRVKGKTENKRILRNISWSDKPSPSTNDLIRNAVSTNDLIRNVTPTNSLPQDVAPECAINESNEKRQSTGEIHPVKLSTSPMINNSSLSLPSHDTSAPALNSNNYYKFTLASGLRVHYFLNNKRELSVNTVKLVFDTGYIHVPKDLPLQALGVIAYSILGPCLEAFPILNFKVEIGLDFTCCYFEINRANIDGVLESIGKSQSKDELDSKCRKLAMKRCLDYIGEYRRPKGALDSLSLKYYLDQRPDNQSALAPDTFDELDGVLDQGRLNLFFKSRYGGVNTRLYIYGSEFPEIFKERIAGHFALLPRREPEVADEIGHPARDADGTVVNIVSPTYSLNPQEYPSILRIEIPLGVVETYSHVFLYNACKSVFLNTKGKLEELLRCEKYICGADSRMVSPVKNRLYYFIDLYLTPKGERDFQTILSIFDRYLFYYKKCLLQDSNILSAISLLKFEVSKKLSLVENWKSLDFKDMLDMIEIVPTIVQGEDRSEQFAGNLIKCLEGEVEQSLKDASFVSAFVAEAISINKMRFLMETRKEEIIGRSMRANHAMILPVKISAGIKHKIKEYFNTSELFKTRKGNEHQAGLETDFNKRMEELVVLSRELGMAKNTIDISYKGNLARDGGMAQGGYLRLSQHNNSLSFVVSPVNEYEIVVRIPVGWIFEEPNSFAVQVFLLGILLEREESSNNGIHAELRDLYEFELKIKGKRDGIVDVLEKIIKGFKAFRVVTEEELDAYRTKMRMKILLMLEKEEIYAILSSSIFENSFLAVAYLNHSVSGLTAAHFISANMPCLARLGVTALNVKRMRRVNEIVNKAWGWWKGVVSITPPVKTGRLRICISGCLCKSHCNTAAIDISLDKAAGREIKYFRFLAIIFTRELMKIASESSGLCTAKAAIRTTETGKKIFELVAEDCNTSAENLTSVLLDFFNGAPELLVQLDLKEAWRDFMEMTGETLELAQPDLRYKLAYLAWTLKDADWTILKLEKGDTFRVELG